MKCPRCKGNLVYDRQVYPSLTRLYCLQCGREAVVKIGEEDDENEKVDG